MEQQNDIGTESGNGGDNPILVDMREGSKVLLPLLQQRRLPVAAAVPNLEYGDLCWQGNGPGGLVKVGVEFKSVKDVLKCMTDGRYAGHQLPGMLREYQYVYLLVHGSTREDPDNGVIQLEHRGRWFDATVGNSRFTYRQYASWCHTMSTLVGVRVIRVRHEADAAAEIHSLYRWWTEKLWHEHGSHQVLYTPPPPQAMLVKPSYCRRAAGQLTGIGWERSAAVAQRFKTAFAMVLAEEWEWAMITGIGKTLAKRVVREIREED